MALSWGQPFFNQVVAHHIPCWLGIFFFFPFFGHLSQISAADDKFIARVDGEAISRGEMQAELKRVTRGKEVLPETLPALQAAVVEQLIRQRLVLRQLAEIKREASAADIDQSVLRLEADAWKRQALPLTLALA